MANQEKIVYWNGAKSASFFANGKVIGNKEFMFEGHATEVTFVIARTSYRLGVREPDEGQELFIYIAPDGTNHDIMYLVSIEAMLQAIKGMLRANV